MIKRRKGLQRQTELKRGGPLKRTTPLRSSGPTKPRKPAILKRHPGPQSSEEKAGRVLLKRRSGGVCEVQVPNVCVGVASLWGHRKRRSQSGKAEKWCPTNGLHDCWACELYLTAHDTEAHVRAAGWTVPSTVDPARVPVMRRGIYVWLSPSGDFEPLDFQELAEWVA